MRQAYVGIDVAFAKRKRLPICVCVIDQGKLKPLPIAQMFDKPPAGKGNKAIVEGVGVAEFARSTTAWLKKLETQFDLNIKRIAIDAPSSYCLEGSRRRESEIALDAAGISCFATPTKSQFHTKLEQCDEHLFDGGAVNRLPNANQLWMLVGFELFSCLKEAGYNCVETYPQAFVKEMGWSEIHKSKREGLQNQMTNVATNQGFELSEFYSSLKVMGFGSMHDKLDAYISAWAASLQPKDERHFGHSAGDQIVVLKK